MKHWITLTLFMVFSAGLLAQPGNDECSGVIDLGVAPSCDSTIYNNIGATASTIGVNNIPFCFNGGGVQRDVWFSFTTADTIVDYTITVEGVSDGSLPAIINPQVSLYRGECSLNGLAEILCASPDPGELLVELNAEGLTPNVTYYLRINDFSPTAAPNSGAFTVCVDQAEPVNIITEGGSTACSGLLFDSGGPDGDYSDNENHIFTICPDQPNQCIEFTLDYFNLEDNADELIFYDGDGTNPANIIASINGGGVTGGGGVCFQVQASSGCLTVQFISDGSVALDGFSGQWQCSTQACDEIQPVTINTDVTELEIANALTAAATQVQITDLNCPDGSYGTFLAGDNSDLGLERGVLLTTGNALYAMGPNTAGGGGSPGADNGADGDADLDSLSFLFGNSNLSRNACVLELDVFAATDELVFEYIFGSEEYPEWVGTSFNDIFAFLISGPGITGLPELGNQRNIAVLPNPDNTVVQINSVNNEVNWEFYRNNELGQSLQYDGLTSDYLGTKKSLTARADVIPCQTYHLKLAIADRQDAAFDSGVFISDLKGSAPELTIQFNNGIDYLVETCTSEPDDLVIRLLNAQPDQVDFQVVVGGTASRGVDYLLDIPSNILFEPGETMLSFPITVLSDLIAEGEETITISLVRDFGCGAVTVSEIEVPLRDQLKVEINAGQDTALVCANNGVALSATGATDYFWTPAGVFDNPFSSDVFASPTASGYVYVEGRLGNCVDTDSIHLELIDPMIDITNGDTIRICRGDTIQLMQLNNINDANIIWSPTFSLVDPGSANPLATPNFNTEYEVSVSLPGCEVSDSVFVDVDFLASVELIADTTLCQNYPVQLAEVLDFNTSSTNFQWSPEDGLEDPTDAETLAAPEATTTYTLINSTDNGACADTASVTVTIIPSDLDILQGDSVFLCRPDTASLSIQTSDGSTNVVWSPAVGALSPPMGAAYTVAPNRSFTYYARTTINDCPQVDSIRVQVDSLPGDLALTFEPEKDVYCAGELVTITSPTYEVADFPGINHTWTGAVGAQSPDTLYNLIINTVDTFTYRRITENFACIDSAAQEIFVITPPIITVSPQDTLICPGESVQFQVTVDGEATISWEPAASLSCTDCFDPIATPTETTTYTISVETEASECTFDLMATINVLPELELLVNANPVICFGESVQLFLGVPLPGVTYEWTSPDLPGFSSSGPFLEVSPSSSTTYVLTASSACQGSVTATAEVVVAGPVALMLDAPSEVCSGDEFTLVAETDAAAGLSEQFTWIINGQVAGFEQSLTTVLPGTSVITLNYRYHDCETLTETFTIRVNPSPSLQLPEISSICLGESVVLNEAPSNETTYQWTSTDGTFSSTEAAPVVMPTQTTTYRVIASTQSCPEIDTTFTITVIGDYELTVPDDFFSCLGETVSLTASVTDDIPGTYSWTWPDGSATGATIEVLPLEPTTYTVTFQDEAGCDMATAQVTVTPQDFELSLAATDADGNDLMENDTIFAGDQVTFTASVNPPAGTFSYTYNWTGNADPMSATGQSVLVTALPVDPSPGNLTYAVEVMTDPAGCRLTADFNLIVLTPEYAIPDVFTPNNDNANDVFKVYYNGTVTDFNLRVYNRWGQVVFESSDPDEAWTGQKDGEPQPADLYLYRTTFIQNGTEVEDSGEVMLIR